MPQLMDAEKYLIDHNVGDVISQSFAATENSFPGFDQGDFSSIQKLRYAFKDAEKHHVTVVAGTGDSGATDPNADQTADCPYQVTAWPASDPDVIAAGDTQLHLNDKGKRTAPDSVYNDSAASHGAAGGGPSHVFARPSYQNGVKSVVGASRGIPDVSMTAARNGGFMVYESFYPSRVGFATVGGTSEASPFLRRRRRSGRSSGRAPPGRHPPGPVQAFGRDED